MHSTLALVLNGALTLTQPVPADSVVWLPLSYDVIYSLPYGGPSWSPDGRDVTFVYFDYTLPQYFDQRVEILRADGTRQQCPLEVFTSRGRATWSPLADEIAVFNGSKLEILAPDDCHRIRTLETIGWNPSWSRDGQRIAFETTTAVMTESAASSDLRFVVSDATQPDWSPDGRRIVFVRGHNLWTVLIDGTNERQITASGHDEWPAWSPVGHRIAFTRRDPGSGRQSVWIAAEDGGGATRITPEVEGQDRARPWWSRDGTRLGYFVLDGVQYRIGLGVMPYPMPSPVRANTWSELKRAYR